MAQKILIRDLTLRDGQQSAFATRMTQAQVDRTLPFYKDANFYAMEVWGGAVPDSVMRYLGEDPWDRLEKIKAAVGDASRLTALSRGRNLFGYAPYSDEIIEGFCRESIASGLSIMRIFDALNDVDNVRSTIKYVKKYGGIADCAVCYTIDPHFSKAERMAAMMKGRKLPKDVFTDEYFLGKAREMADAGADMITIKDMSGLIPPSRTTSLIRLFKKHLGLPVDFHTHCTPGYGLASVLASVVAGVDIIDTNIWNFAGGPAAPAVELIYLFCKKLGIEMDVNMEAVGKINYELGFIRRELAEYDAVKMIPNPFNPFKDALPEHIDREFDRAIAAAHADNEPELVRACQAIDAYFNFPPPNELVKRAEIPGGMYTNMVAQMKQLGSEDLLEKAMELIPRVRLDAGLVPLVTPTSQIVGAQAVSSTVAMKNGKDMYSNVSNQFVSLIKGEYGKTPIPIDPAFRKKITGSREEVPYDVSKYTLQPNPVLPDCGGVHLAENEKEVLLLELFPSVAEKFLTDRKKARCAASTAAAAPTEAAQHAEPATTASTASGATTSASSATPATPKVALTGEVVTSPMPGRVWKILVKTGDEVKSGQDVLILESMKMENSIFTPYDGHVGQILVAEGDFVAVDTPMVEII